MGPGRHVGAGARGGVPPPLPVRAVSPPLLPPLLVVLLLLLGTGTGPRGCDGARLLPFADPTQREAKTMPPSVAALPIWEREYPANISGTYKGTWSMVANNMSDSVPFMRKVEGNIVYQIQSSKTDLDGVTYLKGEMVLRNGVYMTEQDVHMKLEGVYVRQVGQVRLKLQSDVIVEVGKGEQEAGGEDYRESMREVAEIVRQPVWSRLPPVWLAGPRRPSRRSVITSLPGTGDPETNILGLYKRCKFDVVLQLSPLPHEPEGEGGGDKNKKKKGALGGGPRELIVTDMLGLLESPGCGVAVNVNASTVHLEAYYNKAINYTLMVTFVSFLQVLLVIRQMEASNTPAAAARVSLVTIGQQAIMDSYLCLVHLTAGVVVEALFNAFATAAFFKFVIFSIFEMRYLLTIWKARRPENMEGWTSMRRELSILYSRFYGALLGGIVVMYQLQSVLRYLLFALFSFWWPQVVANIRNDTRRALLPAYIVGMSATRLAIPMYLLLCPHNFLRLKPDPALAGALAAWVALQAALLLLQEWLGPHCFIPKRFLPEKYDYYRPLSPERLRGAGTGDEEEGAIDCVICMVPVSPGGYMVTPCDHIFHTACLSRWMDVKMECPTCRRLLPPP